jgi:hypothetical protein
LSPLTLPRLDTSVICAISAIPYHVKFSKMSISPHHFYFGLCMLRIIFILILSSHLWEGIRGVAGDSDPDDNDGGPAQRSSHFCVSRVPTQ